MLSILLYRSQKVIFTHGIIMRLIDESYLVLHHKITVAK